MARAAPLSYATAASLALHALGLLAVAAMPKQVPGHAYSLPIVARLAAPEPVVLEAAKPAPKKRAARQKAMPVPPLPPADTATVAQFRQQFIGSAARFLDYPPDALNAEVEGAVVVSVSFAAGVVVVARHEREHLAAACEPQRVEDLGAAERLVHHLGLRRRRVVVHHVVRPQQHFERFSVR